MEYVTVIAIYFVIWWTSLFAVLPLAVRKSGSIDAQEIKEGSMDGAPKSPKLIKVFIINSLVAFVVTFCIWFILNNADYIDSILQYFWGESPISLVS